MKSTFIAIAWLLLTSIALQAQLPKLNNQSPVAGAASPGKLLTQFIGALKPSSFTDDWTAAKGNFLSKAQKVTNAAGVANTVSSLIGFIKPEMFSNVTAAQNLSQTASKVKKMTDAVSLLKTFEGSLKPEAFLSSWAGQRSGWLSALNLLK